METSYHKRNKHFPFFFIQSVPTLLLLLWQPVLSPWALYASNQSETFVEIPSGSTYSTYTTGTASMLKSLKQKRRETPLPKHGMRSKMWALGSTYRECGSNNHLERGTMQKQKNNNKKKQKQSGDA